MGKNRWFRIQAIGTVHRTAVHKQDDYVNPQDEVELLIDPRWQDGLIGIEGFSHLVVLFYFDRAQRRRVSGLPAPAEGRASAMPVGFFATRTPRRPNPIGIACPRLIRRDGNRLVVTGIDAWDGTPVIDIKGYFPRDEQRSDARIPDWLDDLWAAHDADERRNLADSPIT